MSSRSVLSSGQSEIVPRDVWDGWYKTNRWQKKRRMFLHREPLCSMCVDEGKVVAATIVDHVVPHRGDPHLFWNGELQSLCKWHHDNVKTIRDRGYKVRSQKVDEEGWPLG